MSIYQLLFAGTTPIGSLIIGALAERGGVQRAIATVAGLCGLGVVAALLYLRRNAAKLLPKRSKQTDQRPRRQRAGPQHRRPPPCPILRLINNERKERKLTTEHTEDTETKGKTERWDRQDSLPRRV
jgi:hypothetical protein